MKFFSRKTLKPEWVFKSYESFKIWRVFPTKHDKILCELRDVDKKLVKFVCLSIDNGDKIWENLNIDEPWWVQISDVDEDLFFLCEFRRPDFPVQGKIYAIDLENGEILWESDEYDFLFALNGKVYTSRNLIDSRIYFEIDSRTGEVIKEHGENTELINELKDAKLESMNFIETSTPFDEYHPDYDNLYDIVTRFTSDADRRSTPEVLVKRKFLIINYHIAKGEKLSNILRIIDIETGKLAYDDVLYNDLSFFLPDAFFCKDDFVFYVRNQNELVAIKLTSDHEDNHG